jgi:NADPH-dependent glutamate synthase beta subunit-like oxidoreductase
VQLEVIKAQECGRNDRITPQGGVTASNTKYIMFRPHADRNFVPIGGERQAVNQDAVVKLIGFAGNITSSGPQFSGVLIA